MSSDPDTPPIARTPPRRRRRRWIGALAAILVALALATGLSALSAHESLRAARDAMRQGRAALIDGDAEGAEVAFRRARDRFDAVGAGPSGLVFKTLRWLP
jgi:hypothetical protein